MCQNCVDNGLMTQEDLDSGKSPLTAVLGGGNLDDAPEFIRELLGGMAGAKKDPETEAQEVMDGQVASILKFQAERLEKLAAVGIELSTPTEVSTFTEGAAMELMFRQNPSAIAWTLALVLHRYVDLLEKWATLYVTAHADDEDGLDLDAITNPTARAAVEAKFNDPEADLRTGFYL